MSRPLRFIFSPRRPFDLAVCRIVFCAGLLAIYGPLDLAAWADVSDALYLPTPFFDVLGIGVLDPTPYAIAAIVWKLSLVAAALGWHTRIACGAAAIGAFYLLGIPHGMGKLDHDDAIVPIVLAVLALARSGDALSLDAHRRGDAPPQPSAEYTWPIRTVWILLSLVFFAAGFAKLTNGGLDWILSDNLAVILVKQQYFTSTPDPLVDWGLWIAERPWLYTPMAAGVMAVELSYPLALVSRWARVIVVPGMIASLIGFRVLMGPEFAPLLLASAFWVPWEQVAARLRSFHADRRRRRRHRPKLSRTAEA